MMGGFCENAQARACASRPRSATRPAASDNELTRRFFPFTGELRWEAEAAAHLLTHLTLHTKSHFEMHASACCFKA